ncbi:MAG: hypothetical protein V4581_18385 [Bacteroidota bacterium]
MKKLLILLLMLGINPILKAQKTDVVVIGNVHRPMPNYNADTLFNILVKIKPDIILHEMDSTFFTENFDFIGPSNENEQNASIKYRTVNPAVMIRPFEFEGRTQYRLDTGIKQSENPTMQLLDSLYAAGSFTKEDRATIAEYKRLTEQLNAFGFKYGKDFNNKTTDSISKLRQYYQHYKIRGVINGNKAFSGKFVTTATNKTISFAEGYNRFCDFWDMRNKAMANNILAIVRSNPGKKIVVLTGYFHRYYLLELLHKAQDDSKFNIHEFYDYK